MKQMFFYLLFAVLVSACFYDSEEDLYGIKECVTTITSFINDIRPIINPTCTTPCHSSSSTLGGGIVLDGYSSISNYAKNGSLVGSIKHDGFSAMPKDQPKLEDCKIAKIEAWVAAGSPNN